MEKISPFYCAPTAQCMIKIVVLCQTLGLLCVQVRNCFDNAVYQTTSKSGGLQAFIFPTY